MKTREKFATTLSLTTSYVGAAAEDFIHQAFLASKTIADGICIVKEDVYKSWKIRRIASSGLLAARTCGFTPVGTVTIDERDLDPQAYEVNLEICKDDFLVDWSAPDMGRGANNKRLAPNVSDAIINEIMMTVGQDVEQLIWTADSGGTDLFDGWVTKALADAGTVKITGVAITAANVIAQLQGVYDELSGLNIFNDPDVVMAVSRNVGAAYQTALGAVGSGVGYSNLATVGLKPWDFLGVPIFVAPGLGVSTIVCTKKSNLYVGTDMLSDFNEVILKDMSEVDLSNYVRFKSQFDLDANYGWSNELIIQEPSII